MIYGEKNPERILSQYEISVNEAAYDLTVKDPSFLLKRDLLYENAKRKVRDDGKFEFKKKKSRSKESIPTTQETSSNRTSTSSRQAYMEKLQMDIEDTQKQLRFKQMRQGQAQSIKDWAMCDKLQEEMTKLRKEAFKLQEELKQYQTKERKAHWYKKKNKDKLLCNKESENRRRNEEKGTTSHSITIEELFQNSNSSPAETPHHNLDLEFEASPNKNLHSTELPDSENETVIIADNVSTKSPESDILLEKEATTTCTHDTCASEQTQNF